jgi:putative endopeptidase
MTHLYPAAATIAALILLTFSADPVGAVDDSPSIQAAHYGAWGYDFTGQDPTVKPGTDFFLYANGSWLKRTEIPEDRVSFGIFDQLNDLSERMTRKLIEDAATGRSDDPDAAKIGAAYRAFMDETRAEELDAKPLAPDLAAIRAQKTKADVAALMGKPGFHSVFDVSIQADLRASDRYTVYLENVGMGLPDRDYYLTDQLADKKAKYQRYIALILGMIGWGEPEGNAKAIVAFETSLAEASWTNTEARDPNAIYNPMTMAELAAYAPGFDFRRLLNSGGLASTDRVIVTTNTAFPKVAKIFDTTPLDTLKAWQAFHLTNSAATYLSKRFADARFGFYGKTLSGQQVIRQRWKRGVQLVNGSIGEALGQAYVQKYFPPAAKARMETMIKNLLEAYRQSITSLEWMTPETRKEALAKLAKFSPKIGYPPKWRDYSKVKIDSADLVGNVERATYAESEFQIAKLGRPVDHDEWLMTPQTVNAYYNPVKNEIVFPAASLQPPFFNLEADDAVNYSAVGAFIGHEIGHGFDDQGRRFDGDGKLRDWWQPADEVEFQKRAKLLVEQFAAYEPLPGVHVNGELTLGENIGDLGGLSIAFKAWKLSLNGKPAPMIDGLSGEQRFFMGWAQVWRAKARTEYLQRQVLADPHSWAEFRANGPVANIPEFYEAFSVKPGDKLYRDPAKRVKIW